MSFDGKLMRKPSEERRRKARDRAAKWRVANKDRERKTKERWRLAHPEEYLERKRQSYRRHREEICKRVKEADTPERQEAARQRANEWYREHKELRQTEEARKRACEAAKRYAERHPEKRREYEQANKEQRREQLRNWRAKNPEKYKEHQVRYRPPAELARERFKERYQRDPEPYRERARRDGAARRAAKVKVGGKFTVKDIDRLFTLQGGKCAGCGAKFPATGSHRYHVDHIIPLKPRAGGKPGSNGPENLQLLCRPCNCRKNNMSPEEWNRRRSK